MRDWIICLLLGFSALMLFCVGRNPEIQGEDDYLYVANFSMITDAILSFDLSSFKSFSESLINLVGQILCAPRHAPLPALISAVFYAVCYGFHVPFSLNLLHVPIAAISALSILLLYGLFRRDEQIGWILCCAGALLLLFSPIFVISSRSLAEYHLAFIPFTTLIGLWGLDVLNRNNTPHWLIGLALAQIVLSDVLWFITLPVLLFAFVWAARDRKQALIRLFSIKVLSPVLITVCMLLLGSWIAYEKGLSTPLLKMLINHVTKLSTGSPIIASPIYFLECLSVQMGIMLPLLLPFGIAVWWIDGRKLLPSSLLTGYGLTGLLIYGIIFYGLTPERSSVKIAYQIYLLLPFVIISIALMGIIRNRFQRGIVWVACCMAIMLFFEILACVNLTWKIPVSPWSHIFTQWHHGTFAPNQGTKAAGYLFRRWIEATWRHNPSQPVTVHTSHYNMSFAIFSGLNVAEKGWVFIREFGHNRPITVFSAPYHQNHQESFQTRDTVQFIYLLDLTSTLPKDTDVTKLSQDPRLLHYKIRSSSPRNEMAFFYVLPTEGIISAPIPPGEVNMEQLEARYDREYYRYSDFFPRSLEK